MIEHTIRISEKAGLYANQVNQLVQSPTGFNADIFFTNRGRKVNLKSVLGLFSLAILKQAEISLEVSGLMLEKHFRDNRNIREVE